MGTGCRVSPCVVEVLVAYPKPCEPRAPKWLKRWPGFHPARAMEEMYHDPETPPELKKRLQKDLAAYGRVIA
jgi:hypothetical protein